MLNCGHAERPMVPLLLPPPPPPLLLLLLLCCCSPCSRKTLPLGAFCRAQAQKNNKTLRLALWIRIDFPDQWLVHNILPTMYKTAQLEVT
jgi:hypothetical protein